MTGIATPGLVALFGLAALLSLSQAVQLPTLTPVDEAPQRQDFLEFRTALRAAVVRRDATTLLRSVHPKIRNTFGDDSGIETFRQHWHPERRDSEVWSELGAVLHLGGTFDASGSFVAPYVFSRWPKGVEAFEYVAIIGSRVRVRSSPTTQAQALTTLSHALLRLGGDKGYPQRPWTAVVLPDGRRGFIASHFVRSPIDYRASFTRSDGRWLMTMFIAGD